MTYDDAVRALEDIAASGAHVNVFIAGRSGSLLAGLGGRLVRAEGPWVDQEWAPVYVARGGDKDFRAYFVDGGQEHDKRPCFAICRSLLQAFEAVTVDELDDGAPGVYWRALTLGVDGVFINIGVETEDD